MELPLADLHILELADMPVKGAVIEIANLFGGVDKLRKATQKLQDLYTAQVRGDVFMGEFLDIAFLVV